MSAAEQEHLISHSRSSSHNLSPRSNQDHTNLNPQNISPSPSPDPEQVTQNRSTGLFSKLKSS